MTAAYENFRESCATGNMKSVEFYLAQGISINNQNKVNGWTALHWAYSRGHSKIVELLLANGADPDILDQKGRKPADVKSSGVGLTFTPNYIAAPNLEKLWTAPTVPKNLASKIVDSNSKPSVFGQDRVFASPETSSSSLGIDNRKGVFRKDKFSTKDSSISSEKKGDQSVTIETLVFEVRNSELIIKGSIFISEKACLCDLDLQLKCEIDDLIDINKISIAKYCSESNRIIPINQKQLQQSAYLHFKSNDLVYFLKKND